MKRELTPLEQVRKLLAEREQLHADKERYSQMIGELDAQVKSLLETGDIDNEQTLDEIVRVRSRRQMLPMKLEQIDRRFEAIKQEAAPLAQTVWGEFIGTINSLWAAGTQELSTALRPFFASEEEAGAAAVLIFIRTVRGGELHRLKSLTDQAADSVAPAMEQLSAVVARFKSAAK